MAWNERRTANGWQHMHERAQRATFEGSRGKEAGGHAAAGMPLLTCISTPTSPTNCQH